MIDIDITDDNDQLRDDDHEAWLAQATPTLFADRDCIGYEQRKWAAQRWTETYGHFDSIRVSHAWLTSYTTFVRNREYEYCQAAVMHASLGCHHHRWDEEGPCQCVGGTLHRGMCYLCDWEGPNRASESRAVEDGLDHAWPGWRDLPTVDEYPRDQDGNKKRHAARIAAWWVVIHELYPEGWVEQGGPILTRRGVMSTGPHDHRGAHPHGGWDLCGEQDTTQCSLSRGQNHCPGLSGCLSQTWGCKPWPGRSVDVPDDE